MNHVKSCTAFLFLCLSLLFNAQAQNTNPKPDSLGAFYLPNIDTWSIHSSIIGEDYKLYVLRTKEYDTSHVQLPVLYMTDGDWNMTVAMNCFSMLRQDYTTHEPLIVGIGYGKAENKRFRDLDPKQGGPKFLGFIEKEVMPFINEKYHPNKEKAIYGYSMGGLFTTYVLFSRPELFDMVFIGAPAYSGSQLMPSARAYFKDHKDLKSKVFAGVGGYEKEVVNNIDSFRNYMLSQKSPGLKIRTDIAPNANHGAALAQVMQDAIAFAYCERHNAITVDPSIFSQYAGLYINDNKSTPDILIFARNNKLFFQMQAPGEVANELLPQSNNDYFMMENERFSFSFKKADNQSKFIVTDGDKKEYHFSRKE